MRLRWLQSSAPVAAFATSFILALPAHAGSRPTITPVAAGPGPVSITQSGSTVALYSPSPLDPSSAATGGVYLYDTSSGAFTSESTTLQDGTVVTGYDPVISASGSELAVVSGGPLAGESTGGGGIYVRSPSGGAFRTLVPGVFPDGPMAISADGSELAYDVSNGGTEELYVVSTAGGAPTLIESGPARDPSLSGNGTLLAYTAYPTGTSQVDVRNLRTGATQVASSDSAGAPGTGGHAAISSDGRHVALRSADQLVPDAGTLIDVYEKDLTTNLTTTASTTVKERLPPGTASPGGDYCCSPVSISGDGRFVAFASGARLTPDSDGIPALFVKDTRTSAIVRVPLEGVSNPSPANPDPGEFALSADGSTLVFVARAAGSSTGSAGEIELARIPPETATCDRLGPQQIFGLSPDERFAVDSQLEPAPATVAGAVAALEADARSHPRDRGVDARDLADVRAIVAIYRPRASQAGQDIAKLIDDAKCGLLKQGRDSLVAYLSKNGKGDEAQLAESLLDLRDVLEGTASDSQKTELLKNNITGLIERIAPKDKAKDVAGAVNDVYGLLYAHLSGTLKEKTRRVVEKNIVKVVKKFATKWFGSEATELVDHILTLRDVLAGSPSDASKFQTLKDTIASLSVRLLATNILKTPQVRAAMFGFQLGRAFGERIAADLQLIASYFLARECAQALSPKQSTPGSVNYAEATQATVPKGDFYEGWDCVIAPEGFVDSVSGGVVQATKPSNASIKDKILWRITTTGDGVLYDPSFSG